MFHLGEEYVKFLAPSCIPADNRPLPLLVVQHTSVESQLAARQVL